MQGDGVRAHRPLAIEQQTTHTVLYSPDELVVHHDCSQDCFFSVVHHDGSQDCFFLVIRSSAVVTRNETELFCGVSSDGTERLESFKCPFLMPTVVFSVWTNIFYGWKFN